MNSKRQVKGKLGGTNSRLLFAVNVKLTSLLNSQFSTRRWFPFFQLVTGDLVLSRKRFIGCEFYFLPRFY